jgi:D-arabinose 1-dehydrogenase-like Zn-dependent alcohol dehydrogenase
MNNHNPNPKDETSPSRLDRREFLTAGAGLAAAPLLAGAAAQAQTSVTAGRAATATGSQTMRSLRMTAFRQPLEVAEIPVAAPRADGAVVRVEASGVCRSDWHFWNQDWTWMGLNLQLPVVLGHEVGGVVEEVGPDVRTVRVGDRVTIPFHESDGTCPHCAAGRQNLCDHEVIPAIHRSGGWAQYVTISAADLNCIRLPEGVDTLSAAALGCRYMTAYRAIVDRGRVQPGEWVAVHACGGVGLSAVQIAAAMEAMVVAVDVFDNKLAKAREEGAAVTINARDLSPEQVGQRVKEATGGGVHVSIDALGRAFTVQQSIQSLRKGGRHVQAGLTSQEERGQVALPIDLIVTGEWEIVGSKGNPHPNYAELLTLVARRKLNPARLVTREIALSDVTDTLERMTRFETVGFEVITRFA